MPTDDRDDEVGVLARLFRDHPAWIEAAGQLDEDAATSDVYFTTHPGEAWHLERRGRRAVLRPGRSADPDFVFRFTPEAVERLRTAGDDIGAFAVALFESLTASDPAQRVDFRLAAGFGRLLRRGYVRLLVAGGPRVLAFGARRGLRGLRDLRRLVAGAQRSTPEDWERTRD